MRILIAHDIPSGHVGGMNRIMHFTHDPLVELGHQVDYFGYENVSVTNSLARRFVFPWQVLQAAVKAFREGRKYDIVNVHEVQAAWIARLKHQAGNPYVVVTAHGSEHRSWDLALEEAKLGRDKPAFKTRILNPATRLWQIRLGLRHADQVFCVSEQDRDYFAEHMGIARSKLVRFYSGASSTYAVADPARLNRPVKRIVFSGTWRKNKGIEDLVPAFALIASRHLEIRLTVLGGGLPEEAIKAEFPANVRERVEATETSGDEENLKYLLDADIFLLPSLLEGTPLTMMEAMAAALPVVTTDTSGMKDVIQDSENGLLVPIRQPLALAEAVERLIGNPELRVKIATQGQREVQTKYTWEASSKRVLESYERLMSSGRQWLNSANKTNEIGRPLQFCFVSNFFPDWNAGAAGSILAMGKSLEQLGHKVRHQWKTDNRPAWHSSLHNLFVLPWLQYLQVKKELETSETDVVVVSQPFAYPVFEKLPKRFPNTLFLNLTHGWEHRYDIAERAFTWPNDVDGLRWLKRKLAMSARASICRRTATAMGGLLAPCSLDGHFVARQYGVPQEKLLLLTYGVDESFLENLPKPEPTPYVRLLFFGQYVPRKGSPLLERVLPQLGREFANVELTFIVAPEQVGQIEECYRSTFRQRLHVFEWMDRHEVVKICCANDVFLFPSILEGFGKTFLEAMACGLCVVGYGEGGLPDVAVHGTEALYCSPGDEKKFEELLRRCVVDPSMAREIGKRARAKVSTLTWNRTAKTLERYCLERLKQKDAVELAAIRETAGSTIDHSLVSSPGFIASMHDIAGQ